jgi:hypothetical protein
MVVCEGGECCSLRSSNCVAFDKNGEFRLKMLYFATVIRCPAIFAMYQFNYNVMLSSKLQLLLGIINRLRV